MIAPLAALSLVLIGVAGCGRLVVEPPTGIERSAAALPAAARSPAPAGFDLHLVGFHPLADRPDVQAETHHFCHDLNRDLAQCVLFDGPTAGARLVGVEYIASARLLETLAEEERGYWHPHNFEVLSGQIVAPGLDAGAELELMEERLNSYGKTFLLWQTGREPATSDDLPLGPPQLAWSFNHVGELLAGLIERRDLALGVDSSAVRERRRSLIERAEPQYGVDLLDGSFDRPTAPLEGVRERPLPPASSAAAAAAEPGTLQRI